MAKKRTASESIKPLRKAGRPKSKKPIKQIIAIRVDPGLLAALKSLALKLKKPYQSLIHEILEKAVEKAT